LLAAGGMAPTHEDAEGHKEHVGNAVLKPAGLWQRRWQAR
jgi:hypothetical protein